MKRIVLLDSLRGLASLVVVFHHIFVLFPSIFEQLRQHLPVIFRLLHCLSDLNSEAVLFFFIVSGFSIKLSVKKHALLSRKEINQYLYRRFKRILPLYWLALLLTAVLGLITHRWSAPSFAISNLFGNVLFLQTSGQIKRHWFTPFGDNGPLWSLSYEVFYYLFFPIYLYIIGRIPDSFKIFGRYTPNWYAWMLALFISIGSVGILTYIFTPFGAFLTLFFVWYSGVYLAEVYQQRVTAHLPVLILICIVTVMLIMLRVYPSDTLYRLCTGAFLFLACYGYYVTRLKGWFSKDFLPEKLLNLIFHRIGMGSYALYLMHYPVFQMIAHQKTQVSGSYILSVTVMLIIFCVWLEQRLTREAYTFLNIQYI